MNNGFVNINTLLESAIGVQLEGSVMDLMGGAIKICNRISSDCSNKGHMENCISTIRSAGTGNDSSKKRLSEDDTFSDDHIRNSAKYIGDNDFGITPQEARVMANQIIVAKKFVLRQG